MPQILIGIIGIGIDTAFSFLLIPYQALQSLMKFTIHSESIALEAKVRVKLWHRLEVQAQCAVVLTGNRDILAVENARIALHALGQRLDESIMRVAR